MRKVINTLIPHDELLFNLFSLTAKNLVDSVDKSIVEVKLKTQKTFVSLITKRNKARLFQHPADTLYSLTAQEIQLYLILMQNYLESEGYHAVISLREIHSKYRGKTNLDDKTRNSYIYALGRLTERNINFGVQNRNKITESSSQTLVKILDKRITSGKNVFYSYSLGSFGELIKKSKRYSNIVPVEIYKASFDQIMYIMICLYICRILFINGRKKEFKLNLFTIAQNIYSFDKRGINTGNTYDDIFENIYNKEKKIIFKENEIIEREKYFFDSILREEIIAKMNKKRENNSNKLRQLKKFLSNLEKILFELKKRKVIEVFLLEDDYGSPYSFREIEFNNFWKLKLNIIINSNVGIESSNE